MSDETADTGAGAPPSDTAAGDGKGPAPSVRLVAHYIRDLSFENVAAQKGMQAEGTPTINVTVNLDAATAGETRFQIAMKINATAVLGEETRFLVELDYIGVFEVQNVPKEHIHPFLFIECPRQMLPYARRVISDVTRDGGYPPLMLDNVDFAALYRQKLEEIKAQQGDSATA